MEHTPSAVAQAIDLCLSLHSQARLLSRAAAQFIGSAIDRNGGDLAKAAEDLGASDEMMKAWLELPVCAGIMGSLVCHAATGVNPSNTQCGKTATGVNPSNRRVRT